MSTAAQVVRSALRRLNVVARGEEVSPEDAADGLEILNNMISAWETEGVRVRTDVPLPSRHKQGIIAMLAVRLAPTFNKPVSAELASEANEGWTGLLAEYFHVPRSRFDGALLSMPSQRHVDEGVLAYQDWKPLTDYATSTRVVNNARIYECSIGGRTAATVGPTGSGTEIDGTVTWVFVGTL